MRILFGAVVFGVVVMACNTRESAPPANWEPDRACDTNDDCVPMPSCCPAPCTSDVIHKKDLAKAQARAKAQCAKESRGPCPQAGACPGHVYACVRAKCALVLEGSPDWPNAKPK